MNIALVLAFVVALGGFVLTFLGLRQIHLKETNRPIIFLSVGLTLIVVGALFFFLESLYRGLLLPSTVAPQAVSTQQPTPAVPTYALPVDTQANTTGTQSGDGTYSPQIVQQFMASCQATIGQQKPTACQCILQKLEQQYTAQQLQAIKSPKDLSPQATAAITSCIK